MTTSEKVAIVGASGYSGEELVRLLIRHPHAELVALTSRQVAGQTMSSVFPRFAGMRYADLAFIPSEIEAIVKSGAKIAFLALPHGVAHEFAGPLLNAGLRVIDLSADFRIKDVAVYAEFYGEEHHAPQLAKESVYGLVENSRDALKGARLVASPGCYPTSILLPLIPLLKAGLLETDSITVSSMSGVSGAGRNAKVEYLYAECNESVRAYGVPKHRHLAEIEQELTIAAGVPVKISFTPHLIPVTRGIHTTIYAKPKAGVDPSRVESIWENAYDGSRFVRRLKGAALPDIKNVTNTNFIDIAWRFDSRTGRLVVLSAEDNLVKGAAGQAVQAMNVICDWPEESGLI
ncbi:MAG: N-acetyl-gamma-glutamyl-phosphate reductase [Verrucomicrobiota bacterium]